MTHSLCAPIVGSADHICSVVDFFIYYVWTHKAAIKDEPEIGNKTNTLSPRTNLRSTALASNMCFIFAYEAIKFLHTYSRVQYKQSWSSHSRVLESFNTESIFYYIQQAPKGVLVIPAPPRAQQTGLTSPPCPNHAIMTIGF